MSAALPAFCFKGVCPDGKTVVFVNVVGDPDPSLIPVTRGSNVPLLPTASAEQSSFEQPSLRYLDTNGLANLMVPIAVGESRKLMNPNKKPPTADEKPAHLEGCIVTGSGSENTSSSSRTGKRALVEEIVEEPAPSAVSSVGTKPVKKPKKVNSPSSIDYDNSVVVDVVVFSGVTHRVHPMHPLFESYLTHLIPLILQWVKQEQGLTIVPNTVAMLTVLDPSVRASEATVKRVGESIVSGVQGEGLRGTKYIVGERRNMIFPPGTKLSDDPSQTAAVKAQEEEAALWSKINEAADAMAKNMKLAEAAKVAAAEASSSEAVSHLPRDLLVSKQPESQKPESGKRQGPLIEEIFADGDNSAAAAVQSKKATSASGESFVKKGFLNQLRGSVNLYPEGGSTEGEEAARKAAVAYREAQLANIPPSLRGKCQIVDMSGVDDSKTKTKPSADVQPSQAPTNESCGSASPSIVIEDEDPEPTWTHSIAWNVADSTVVVEIMRAGEAATAAPPDDVEIEPTHIDVENGKYVIPLVAQQAADTPLFQLTVDHEDASAAYSKKKGILTVKAKVLSTKRTF